MPHLSFVTVTREVRKYSRDLCHQHQKKRPSLVIPCSSNRWRPTETEAAASIFNRLLDSVLALEGESVDVSLSNLARGCAASYARAHARMYVNVRLVKASSKHFVQ